MSFWDRARAFTLALNAFAWGKTMPALLLGVGVYLSFRTDFVQVRFFFAALKRPFSAFSSGNRRAGSGLTPLQAVCTALAGSVGTGNIAGVAVALFLGGPGAVFWMWVSAFFGMATKYAEIALAVKYRQQDKNGRPYGGPMFYMARGLGRAGHALAFCFALFGGLASFGIGNLTQSVEIAGAARALWGAGPRLTGLLLALTVGAVLLGGAKRVAAVTAGLVPVMGALYVLTGLGLILSRAGALPAAFAKIFKGAFSLSATGGGALGFGFSRALRQGVARGVFSNEAGLGSAPIAHAAADGKHPEKEGLWGIFEVFFDTVIVCTVTALTLILSGVLDTPGGLAGFASGGEAALAAFNALLPGAWGGAVLRVCVLFFALSTLFAWSFYGEACWRYLSGDNKTVLRLYRLAFVFVCALGATGAGGLAWEISDILNGLMALPNLAALVLLGRRKASK